MGMIGIWLSYTVAEVITFVIFLIMNHIMKNKMQKIGVNVNNLLLDKNIDDNIYCFTFDCGKDDFNSYNDTVLSHLEPDEKVVSRYLLLLNKCHNSQNGKYIEVEINKIEQKIIIRDNLNHLSIQDDITEIISGESNTEYGPVLGINRICIE